MIAYHGTKVKFSEFDFTKSGSVNGTHNGYGSYFSENKDVAFGYSSRTNPVFTFDGIDFFRLDSKMTFLHEYISFTLYGRDYTRFRKRPDKWFDSSLCEYPFSDLLDMEHENKYLVYTKPIEVREMCISKIKNMIFKLENLNDYIEHLGNIDFTTSDVYKHVLNKLYSFLILIQSKKKLWYFRTSRFGFVYKVELSISEEEILNRDEVLDSKIAYRIYNRFKSDYRKLKLNLQDLTVMSVFDSLKLPYYSDPENWRRTCMFLHRCGIKAIRGVGICVFDKASIKILEVLSAKHLYVNELVEL